MTVAGVVLAGGGSRRMGRTKALVEIDGVAMGDRVLAALDTAGCDPLLVYGGDPDELRVLAAPVVADRYPGEGPVGGVLGALEHLGESVGRALVVACDLPDIGADVLDPLLAADLEHGHVAVASTDRAEPMCAVWSRRSRPIVRAAFDDGERALHRVLERLDVVDVPVPPAGLRNVNTPDDLVR